MAKDKESKGILRLTRNSTKDIGMRGLEVFIDERFVADVQFGKTVDIPLEPGEHTLKATNSLYSQKDTFEIQAGEVRAYELANVGGLLFNVITSIGGTGPYKVTLKHNPAP